MKKTALLLVILLACLSAFSQSYDLKFSQVIDLTSGQSYTVPANKVLKIESISSGGYSVIGNYSYCSSAYSCIYKAALYVIGNITDSVQITGSYAGASCICPPTYTSSNYSAIQNPSVTFPIWLKSGQVVSVAPGNGLLISGIEFNITQ